VQGILEVSRAFGDARFKKYIISTPDVFKSTLTTNDRYCCLESEFISYSLFLFIFLLKPIAFLFLILIIIIEKSKRKENLFMP